MEFTKIIGVVKMESKRMINISSDISLSDAIVCEITNCKNDITVNFSEHGGFFKKDKNNGKYYRTSESSLILKDCNIDDISIKEIRMHKISEGLYCETMMDISLCDFLSNINSGEYTFEFVEEFYNSGKALFIGYVKKDDDHFWCHIKLSCGDIVCYWKELKYDMPY